MVLVDTSVWIDHLRRYDERMGAHLRRAEVIVHPFVVGEMALGGELRRRAEILLLLSRMPQAPVASHSELLAFIERRGLGGRGIGYVDAHLLASAFLAGTSLWTHDKRLHGVASSLGIA
jgi:predicted nucleic acid-binding protein